MRGAMHSTSSAPIDIRFNVERGKASYIGDLHFDADWENVHSFNARSRRTNLGDAMNDASHTVQGLRPDREILTRQRLPYFVGISGATVGAQGLSMHLVVIPPGARAEPHRHIGYETGIYVLEGEVLTRWGARLEHEVVSRAGDFLFVPPDVPHEAINLSATEPARAVVARNHPAEQDLVEPVDRPPATF